MPQIFPVHSAWCDPFAAFEKFYRHKGGRGLFFLDSSRTGTDGRYSYLGFSPFAMIEGRDLAQVQKAFYKHRRKGLSGIFPGGAVGYLAYDGSLCFGFYDQVLAFDHVQKRLTIHASNQKQIKDILDALKESERIPVVRPMPAAIKFKSNFSKAAYMAAVNKALAHIRQGDIYQINLSRIIEARIKNWRQYASPDAVYSALRTHSPSPFAAYFDDGQQVVLSSSPERFVSLSGRIAQLKPMKGTRPRGTTKAQDARLKKDLGRSAKEIAELLMVTDLERNDLGRVCEYGSVKVKAMRTIEAYKTVFQATATIEGSLRKDRDAFDLLAAVFPGGSVTGCPKIEAMKIIRQLEGDSRRLYTGALGYISFTGHMDFSVLIRTLFLRRDKIVFHVGGGIVADSKAAAEYEETCVKARGMHKALAEVFHA